MFRSPLPIVTLASAAFAGSVALAVDPRPVCPPIVKLRVDPQRLVLDGPGCRFSLLVTGERTRGDAVDLTRVAAFVSRDPDLVEIGPDGVAQSVADGKSQIEVTAAGRTLTIPVQISGSHRPRALHFENDILPILSRFGCNSSGCHGKAEGQNGFKLSVFGFDPRADRLALLEEGRGRRIFPAAPDESLMLKKATGSVPHGGGVRIQRASPEYRLLREWIAAGAPEGDPAAPRVVSIRVTPRERRLQPRDSQQLRVIARYTDGREVDVTSHAKFQSNREELAGVDNFGLVTAGDHPGEAAVMAAYMNEVDVFRALIPLAAPNSKSPGLRTSPPPQNFIDRLVDPKLQRLNLLPSLLCTDEEFVRRASTSM